jgi:putative nucleotidyltransferase with HDIG domain
MGIDTYDNPDAERLLAAREQRLVHQLRQRRELITDGVGAVTFLAAAVALACLVPWQRQLSATNVALVLISWALVERVKFPVASGWTYPTMLAFVPALFLLPTPIVPLVAMVAVAMRAAPGLIRGRLSLRILLTCVADAWFTIGPVLVIVVGHAQRFSWSHWPVYLAALLAQVLFDIATTLTWTWIGDRISPRVELPLLSWIYLVDAALAPLGLLIAAAAVARPGLVLVALSPTAMLFLFARERQQRLGQTQALSTAYRGTALLLGDVVEADDHYTGSHSREVVDLSLAVADALGLDATARQNVEFAALLHDVGKIRVDKEIINKRGALDDAEWTIIRRHTIDGEQMLMQVGGRSPTSAGSSAGPTSASMVAGTRTGWPGARSRSNRGSSRSVTRTAR